jgi:hypothetical protein
MVEINLLYNNILSRLADLENLTLNYISSESDQMSQFHSYLVEKIKFIQTLHLPSNENALLIYYCLNGISRYFGEFNWINQIKYYDLAKAILAQLSHHGEALVSNGHR